MVAAARVGGLRVGVVHGDTETLAGWAFAVEVSGRTRETERETHGRGST